MCGRHGEGRNAALNSNTRTRKSDNVHSYNCTTVVLKNNTCRNAVAADRRRNVYRRRFLLYFDQHQTIQGTEGNIKNCPLCRHCPRAELAA